MLTAASAECHRREGLSGIHVREMLVIPEDYLYLHLQQVCVVMTMTAFEPEAGSQIITGLEFHKFYFDNRKSRKTGLLTMYNKSL